MTFEAKLRQSHNFLTAVSTVYRDIPKPQDLTTMYEASVNQFCEDLKTLLGYP